jgi:hypothetical protein
MIIVFGAMYFSLTMSLASSGQKIVDLRHEKDVLAEANEKSRFAIAENESIGNVSALVESLDLQGVEAFHYVTLSPENVVAKR